MNIAVFSECYHPTQNGVVVSIDTFAEGLRQRGHRVEVFAPGFPGYRVELPHVHRFPSTAAPHVPDYPMALPYWPKAYRAFDRLQPDLVHAQSVFMMSRLGAYLARRNALPLVGTYHTLVPEYSHYIPLPSAITRRAAVALSRTFCNACDVVLTPTASIQPVLRSYGVRTTMVALPTGIRPSDFEHGDGARVRRRHGLADEAPLLLFVGRIAREKNIDFLLHALKRLLPAVPSAQLLLVGPGPYRRLAAAYASRLGLSSQVVFTGGRPRSELRHYYAAADVFVFPSRTDTQGLVLVEAMAAGLPSVAVRATGSCDVVRHDRQGVLVEASVSAFAAAVASLLADGTRRERYAEACRLRAQDFSTAASLRQLEALYRQVLRLLPEVEERAEVSTSADRATRATIIDMQAADG